MRFIDEIKIYAKAGNGGNGIVSWFRYKYVPKGGPAGGNGGKGGDVYFRAVQDLAKLGDYVANPKFKAEKGGDGRRELKEGKNGEDLYIDVPVGSKIIELNENYEFSLHKVGETIKVLSGGHGGYGNEHFKSSHQTTPEIQTDGKIGAETEFFIELELLVDLGLVGLPSAGKSSLMNTITAANAKVGDYPFTTLEPSLGIFHNYILADIPGLIEGASEGKGLGYKFLKHIKKTKTIAHLVSFENEDMIAEYEKIKKELEKYSAELLNKKEVIVLSKSDLVSPEIAEKIKKGFEKKYQKPVLLFSIIDDHTIKEFSSFLSNFLKD